MLKELSGALVAFTVEFDNEVEQRMPHSTSDYGLSAHDSAQKPWLVSMAMWANCLRFVGEDGVTGKEMERLARTGTNLHGMQRWGYIKLGDDGLFRLRPAGRLACAVCGPLVDEIEGRWRKRFGDEFIRKLQSDLIERIGERANELPDAMPILGYGLSMKPLVRGKVPERAADVSLPALLAKSLILMAQAYQAESDLSLALSANVVRVIPDEGARVSEMPRLSGVSKEAVAMGLKYLVKRGLAELGRGAGRAVRLTARGRRKRLEFVERVKTVEREWQGLELPELRDLQEGMKPYPDGWRARVEQSEVLPWYPMVLHRGGWPDGS